MKQTEFKNVPLKDIAVGKLNHRKIFDEQSSEELISSIREKGVLQPIVLRYTKAKDKYELVCGERRYRAAVAVQIAIKDRNEIPATIRELTDDEVIELQIIENLQRKDVHPMEEGAAFKQLVDAKGWSPTEIAQRVGKSPKYVAQRLKLNDLILEYQKAFFQNRISLVDVTKLFRLNAADQKDLYKREGHKEGKIDVDNNDINGYLGDLSDPPFDPKDATLLPVVGACTTCQYNSGANALLFPDEKRSMCMQTGCFKDKTTLFFKRELARAKSDPAIALVSDDHTLGTAALALTKSGDKVYSASQYVSIDKPEVPNPDDDWQLEIDNFDSKEERQVAINEAFDDYKKELADYEKKCQSGKYLRAFIVEGEDKGKYAFITLKKDIPPAKGTAAEAKAKESSGQLTAKDIESEIDRINTNEKRKKELDEEKITPRVLDVMMKNKEYFLNTKALAIAEQIGVILALKGIGGYGASTKMRSLEKVVGLKAVGNGDLADYEALIKLTPSKREQLINGLLRIVLFDKLSSDCRYHQNATRDEDAAAIQSIAMIYEGDKVKKIRKEHMDERAARQVRIAERISKLKEQKKELTTKKK